MGKVVKEYFDNSYKELVNFFVEQKKLIGEGIERNYYNDRKRR